MRRGEWLCLALALFALSCGGPDGMRGKGSSEAADAEAGKRARMVDTQIVARGVRDARVLAAVRAVPRHLFVDPGQRAQAYEDHPLPIAGNQTISQPYIVALMTQLLELQPTARVLEIGTGSGYQSAVLGKCALEVYSIEILPELARSAAAKLKDLHYDNVTVKEGDGYRGWPEHAPFDGIIVTAAPARIPQPLLDQLAPGGRMVIPVGGFFQELKVFSKDADGKITEKDIIPVRFVPMTGEAEKTPGDAPPEKR
ncbi:MAG TPA: protein-L-isoaspartate(D-aspartate) O-methyltransferase, partial [Thermoanaerobaculia bacterium]|nr:protein-L-isoaspartate(D-aspartate) O-methyltransferase [Thermoanaerobaculia bacterium]